MKLPTLGRQLGVLAMIFGGTCLSQILLGRARLSTIIVGVLLCLGGAFAFALSNAPPKSTQE